MFIPHVDVAPLVYGVVIFIGIWSMFAKLAKGRFGAFIIEVSVFVLVFKLHGGSMAGGFAAAIAALLAGFFMPKMFGFK